MGIRAEQPTGMRLMEEFPFAVVPELSGNRSGSIPGNELSDFLY